MIETILSWCLVVIVAASALAVAGLSIALTIYAFKAVTCLLKRNDGGKMK